MSPTSDSLTSSRQLKQSSFGGDLVLIGNHDLYKWKKGTQFVATEPQSDEILIVLIAKGTHCEFAASHNSVSI